MNKIDRWTKIDEQIRKMQAGQKEMNRKKGSQKEMNRIWIDEQKEANKPTAPMLRKVAPANNQPYIKSGQAHNALNLSILLPASYARPIGGHPSALPVDGRVHSMRKMRPAVRSLFICLRHKKATKRALFFYLSSAPLPTFKSDGAGSRVGLPTLRSLSVPYPALPSAPICRFL